MTKTELIEKLQEDLQGRSIDFPENVAVQVVDGWLWRLFEEHAMDVLYSVAVQKETFKELKNLYHDQNYRVNTEKG